MSNIISTTNNTQGQTMFNTTRFIDVSTKTQRSNGTTMFLDSNNPGVYYTSNTSGYVYRTVTSQTSVTDFITGLTNTTNSDQTYQINRRCSRDVGNGITSVLLPRANDRLSRIQEMANKFNRDMEPRTHTGENFCVMISPRLK
tara:strand:- start:923 stop:1351 length:429 start_codon:yes stop_codon:yes gene_type:complete